MAAKPTLKLAWTDMGWARLYKDVIKAGQMHVKAGLVGTEGAKAHPLRGDLTVAEVAMIQEFGNGHQESRSFIRRALLWSAAARREYRYLAAKVSQDVMFRKVPRSVAMQAIGVWAAARIKETILSNVPPPNRPSTVSQKGHGHTLVWTDTMYDSVGYEIASGRGED